ncbi:ribonuclease H-like domain-containing protein [Tanacetum coccineum]|uniref:Ribonuclease H-like domain-containing protein n=1 Tax=Tanacetum coccineum TaxID=301880 RepID=A0ABQ5ILP9_9ASTR
MTNDNPPPTPALTLSDKLMAMNHLTTFVPEKLDVDAMNYSSWVYYFSHLCHGYGILDHLVDPVTSSSTTTPNDPPTVSIHPMVTRSRIGTTRPNPRYAGHVSTISPLPRSYKEAFNDPNWRNAMFDEYNALIKNKTWTSVPRPEGANIVRCMWLFRHKFLADGTLSPYKARLVANGITQVEGVDVDETFSPVVKLGTIRTVLSLAISRHWLVHQLDVKNAFLHGDLAETVYMHQPPGFRDPEHPDYVCLLQRSLYGLKQAPRAWFQRFAAYITTVGFTPSRCDSSLFIYRQGDDTAFLLLYVDDIVLTASSDRLLQQIIASLHREFSMTDLGALNYFLGISVTRDSSGMFLSQRKYAMEILELAHMVGCNSSQTPVDTESKLGDGGTPVVDPTLYRSLAGSLQYLTFTRPDITYAVQQVCLYMHDPREPHFSALKRILRYVQGTLDYGLQLFSSTTDSLIAYSDADWAGCPTTRRSTSGYCIFLGNNLLSWSPKRQPMLSRSSAEAEYHGVANAVAETCWIRNLLRELHTPLSSATIVYCDNVSVVYLSSNPVQHQRTKHIEIDIHFVRDLVATGQVRVLHVPSRFQYADIFTKGLPSALFDEFRDSLSVRCTPAPTVRESVSRLMFGYGSKMEEVGDRILRMKGLAAGNADVSQRRMTSRVFENPSLGSDSNTSINDQEGKYADILSTMSTADIDAVVNAIETIGKKFQDEVNKAAGTQLRSSPMMNNSSPLVSSSITISVPHELNSIDVAATFGVPLTTVGDLHKLINDIEAGKHNELLSGLTNDDRMETLDALGSICNSIQANRNNACVTPCKSVDINTKSTSYAGAAGASAKDQPNVNSNFRTFGADLVFDGVNVSIPRKVVEKAGLEAVLEGGPWLIRKSPIIIKKWSMDTRLLKEELTRILIWVKLHDVPIQVFEEDGISLIATFIGKPVMLDSYTSSMCNESWGGSSFARCLIKINSEADLVDVVTIGIPSLSGDVMNPPIVTTSNVATPTLEKTNDGFQTVGKKKKRKCKFKSTNGGQFTGPLVKHNVRYEPKATTTAPKKGATYVGNTSQSSSMLKTTSNLSKRDNISMSNSFSALNNEEEDVENVHDESANLIHNTNAGGSSSFTAAAG